MLVPIEEMSLNKKVNSLETEEIWNKISGVSDRHYEYSGP